MISKTSQIKASANDKGYKSSHHIGRRKSVSKIVTYNETLLPSTEFNMSADSITGNRILKQKGTSKDTGKESKKSTDELRTEGKGDIEKLEIMRKQKKKQKEKPRETFLRREASLNAEAMMNLIYDKYDKSVVKKPKVKAKQIVLSNITEMKVGAVNNSVMKRENIKLKDKNENLVPAKVFYKKSGLSNGVSKKIPSNTKNEEINVCSKIKAKRKSCDNQIHKTRKKCNRNSKSKDNGAAKGKVKKLARNKLVAKSCLKDNNNNKEKQDGKPARHSKRMASLNAQAILVASFEKTKTQLKVKDIVPKKRGRKRKCDITTNIQDSNCSKKPAVPEKRRKFTGINLTKIRPLNDSSFTGKKFLSVLDKSSMIQAENTIRWTNADLLQSKSDNDVPVKSEIVIPTPQLAGRIVGQTTVGVSNCPCAPAAPVVPSSQYQSFTVGGLGSITNLPMMPYGSAFSVPTYPSAIYPHGYYQPAGPLIQALPDACLLSHPVPIQPVPQSAAFDQRLCAPTFQASHSLHTSNSSTFRVIKPKKVASGNIPAPNVNPMVSDKKKTVDKLKRDRKPGEKSKKAKVAEEAKGKKAEVKERKPYKPRNPWMWHGEPEMKKIPSLVEGQLVERKCYPAIRHKKGDIIKIRDCVLLRSGPHATDLPYIAKIASLWVNPSDGEKMMSLLWYYRPEHTETGRLPHYVPEELHASKHWDENSVACIDDRAYVLTCNEFARYKAEQKRLNDNFPPRTSIVPEPTQPYSKAQKLPGKDIHQENVFLCRSVYDFRQKRILKNPL